MRVEELLAGTPFGSARTFSAPWEARAFAIALGLSQAGICSWEEFRQRLIGEIGRADAAAAGEGAGAEQYYTHFLAALERLLRDKGIVDSGALDAKMRELSVPVEDDD